MPKDWSALLRTWNNANKKFWKEEINSFSYTYTIPENQSVAELEAVKEMENLKVAETTPKVQETLQRLIYKRRDERRRQAEDKKISTERAKRKFDLDGA